LRDSCVARLRDCCVEGCVIVVLQGCVIVALQRCVATLRFVARLHYRLLQQFDLLLLQYTKIEHLYYGSGTILTL
jgi:hypothetical protein